MKRILIILLLTITSLNAQVGEKDIRANVLRSQDVFKKLTLEQEYYLGRAVGANILSKYTVLNDPEINGYINKLGLGLTLLTKKTQTYGGYHFLVLDSDEINAFAAPSGHIFITKGLIKLAESEDELAAILAHEISHIVLEHGTLAIKKASLGSVYSDIVSKAVEDMTDDEFNQLQAFFVDSVLKTTQVFINTGYSKKVEIEADQYTVYIMKKAGYDPRALNTILARMHEHFTDNNRGFSKTHPKPFERVKYIKELSKVSGYFRSDQLKERFITFRESILSY